MATPCARCAWTRSRAPACAPSAACSIRSSDAQGRAQGVTGVVLLVESHLAVHTWPELRSVTADVYVCNLGADNSARAEAVMAQLVAAFGPREPRIQRVQRGEG